MIPTTEITNTTDTDLVRQRLRALVPMVIDSVPAANTRRAYTRALYSFFDWYAESKTAAPFGKALVQRYVQTLIKAGKSPATCNQSITVLRKLASEATDNGLLDSAVSIGVDKIKAIPRRGKRTGRWLTAAQATRLIATPDLKTLKGKRDRVLLGMLLECGLRREEASAITVDQFQQRDGRAIFADVKGKGGRIRTVPIPRGCATRISDWIKAAKIKSGRLLLQVNKGDRIEGRTVSAPAIYKQVVSCAKSCGLKLAPHDLRRTFGKLSYKAGAKIDQISQGLGHSSLRTTEIYLGVGIDDLEHAACDLLNLDPDDTKGNE